LWLRAHLGAKQLAAVKEAQQRPVHLSHPPITVQQQAPVLDNHGIPWMCKDGTLITNQSKSPALRATADESKSFFKRGAVPITFTSLAPVRASSGYMALQNSAAIYSGNDLLTEDEDEPPREAVRHNTKPRSPPIFSGQPGSLDYIEWCREVDNWFHIDTHQRHERASHAASYLSGPAAEFWRHLKQQVLGWYVSRLPGRYITPDNQPYIPWTAMKKAMAEEYAGFDKLEQLRANLKTLKRKPSQSAPMYNTSFRMLVADIATFGSRQVSAESELITLYLDNCDYPIPKLQQDPNTLKTAPWSSLDALMRQGIMEGTKQQQGQQLHTFKATSDSSGKAKGAGGKQGSNQRGRGSSKSRGKPSAGAASITALQQSLQVQQQLLATFLANSEAPSTSSGKRGPFPQKGILKRARFNTPPPSPRAEAPTGTSSGNHGGGGGRPMCSYIKCGKPGHTYANCYKRQNDEAAAAGKPLPYPPEYFQKGKH
jgi:Retrotransposon gag protein